MAKNKNTPLRVVELFAGVGGFRLGLEGPPGSPYGKCQVIWSNQWEPSTKAQYASMVYEKNWGPANHSNADIATVPASEIPDCDLLAGGFPCQDYSVATTLKKAGGLLGKKGVLWWQIHRILCEKKNKPPYLFLENVDRLLQSPAKQRGRDFALMLRSLGELGYAVEWRVINAADYGMPQRRRRVFILGYRAGTGILRKLKKTAAADWLLADGVLANAFPVSPDTTAKPVSFALSDPLEVLSQNFGKAQKNSLFQNTGLMLGSQVFSLKTQPVYDGPRTLLGDVLQNGDVPAEFFISKKDLPKWQYFKGAKKETRRTKEGFEYEYAEGGMAFPDSLDSPSRTIITGEGGSAASRFKHVVLTPQGHRRLTPLELERLNMFPDGHTELPGITDTKRAFFMGNALVVGVVRRVGEVLFEFVAP